MKLAIADPPYPPEFGERRDRPGGKIRRTMRSRASRWYGDGPRDRGGAQPADFHADAGEWDYPARHRLLLEQLCDEYDGWCIATTPDGLDHYRPLPIVCKTLAWVKPRSMPTASRIASSWEAVIVFTPEARRAHPRTGLGQVPDVLVAPARAAGFVGSKPPEWTRWVLDAMGYDADTDTVHDMFPGSGAVGRELSQGVLL